MVPLLTVLIVGPGVLVRAPRLFSAPSPLLVG